MSIRLASGLRHKGVRYVARGLRVTVRGSVRPFVEGQSAVVEVKQRGRTVARKAVAIKRAGKSGRFVMRFTARRAGAHTVGATHRRSAEQEEFSARRQSLRAISPRAGTGSRGTSVRVLQEGLSRLGFVTERGGKFGAGTSRAVIAFRKVNGMRRTGFASAEIFRKVLSGRGGFKLRYPKAGKHVEYDFSRQVLVLARGGKPERIYHSASGAPATPTVFGTFRFYRKQPGTNAKGMVHSSYFIRGYAIHGFKSVPTQPASHGCLRVPIPNALSIFRWVKQGDQIMVYR